MAEVDQLRSDILECVQECSTILSEEPSKTDLVIERLESAECAIDALTDFHPVPWAACVSSILQDVILILSQPWRRVAHPVRGRGRPKFDIPFDKLEYFLSLGFKISQLAKMFNVSPRTISRNLMHHNYSARTSYTQISDEALSVVLLDVLRNQPNTGYKRMKGHLLARQVKVTERRVRELMKFLDPIGVYQRTLQRNQQIRRRSYYVKYSNQMWHLDGNHKLIRWGIVIRSGIDGKSRTVTYMEATNNNRADTHMESFVRGVHRFGVPMRTRSDKGKENVDIARFMISNRGTGRSSHLCGRSVHNQRIERHWRDLFYGCTSMYYTLFTTLEADGLFNVDNEKHRDLLHRVFLPRLNIHLSEFVEGWNNHPLSSENYKTPLQLMILNLPPQNMDLLLEEEELVGAEFVCNRYSDLDLFDDGDDERITNPIPPNALSELEVNRLAALNILRDSESFGYDVFQEALRVLSV